MHRLHSVKQEIAKEGVLPFSRFWASNEPFRTPAAALVLHWIFAMIFIVAPPAGDLYSFIINLASYQGACLATLVGGGLLYLQYRKSENWTSPFHCHILFTLVFVLSNVISLIVPFIPPKEGNGAFESIPYYVFPLIGFAILILGVIYWFGFLKVFPRLVGYKFLVEREILVDGSEVVRYKRIRSVDIVSNENSSLVSIEEAIEKIV